ncbi:hypothetical protein BM527_16285 [Alteromonas sp. Mex14]|nr:hypothetical protein BM527_16285 [Alteromonas sp. Mex14]
MGSSPYKSRFETLRKNINFKKKKALTDGGQTYQRPERLIGWRGNKRGTGNKPLTQSKEALLLALPH